MSILVEHRGSTVESADEGPAKGRHVRHAVGLDLGTSSLRVQVAHYDAVGRPVGEPAALHLPHSERDGAMLTVLQLSPAGDLLSYGRAAVQSLPHTSVPAGEAARFVAEFKPCIGQSPEDLAAQGRPEKARHCTNAGCPRPGWAWSVALQFCGFCGGALTEPTERWQPLFPYPPEEALEYARLLLSEVRLHLERRLNEPLRQQTGWQIVAGVPVHWQAGTRARYQQVLAQAFPEAGITLLSEPEGALHYYGCQGLVRAGDGWTLVVDFGAGTTDLVLGRVFNRGSHQVLGEVRAYGERYGGADFDLLLAQYAAAELGVELDAGFLSRWKLEAQRWKEAFSDAAQFDPVAETGFSFPVPLGAGSCDFRQVVVDRPRFQRVAGELVGRFRSVLERGLRHFGTGGEEVTQVVLTGGGAQWYFVEEAVRELCPGAHVIGGVEPVRAIARGLALAPALPKLLEAPPRPPEPPAPEPAQELDPEQKVELVATAPPAEPRQNGPSAAKPRAAAQATPLLTFRTPGRLLNAAFSPDGSMAATGLEVGNHPWGKGSVLIWDTATGQEQKNLLEEIPQALDFSSDGTRLACLFATGTLQTRHRVSSFEVGSWKTLWSSSHNAGPVALAYSPAGDFIAVSSFSSAEAFSVNTLHATTGEIQSQLLRVNVYDPLGVAFSPDGSALGIACSRLGSGAGNVRVYRGAALKLEAWIELPMPGFSWTWALKKAWSPVAFSPDGESVAVGSRARTSAGITGRIYLLRWRRDRAESPQWPESYAESIQPGTARELDGHRDQVVRIAFSPDGRTLASGSHDGSVLLWDLESGEVRQTLRAHSAGVVALAFSRDGDRMMSAGGDNVVQIWGLG